MYSAPLMGLANGKANSEWLFSKVADNLDEMVLTGTLQVHKICQNKAYVRQFLTNRKANPFLTASLGVSLIRNINALHKKAEEVTYPYQMILGDKDVIVDNSETQKWH